jgi:hypothetical protein
MSLTQSVQKPEPGILYDFFRNSMIRHVASREPEHSRVVALDQDHEGTLVSGPEAVQEWSIRIRLRCLQHRMPRRHRLGDTVLVSGIRSLSWVSGCWSRRNAGRARRKLALDSRRAGRQRRGSRAAERAAARILPLGC